MYLNDLHVIPLTKLGPIMCRYEATEWITYVCYVYYTFAFFVVYLSQKPQYKLPEIGYRKAESYCALIGPYINKCHIM